MSDLFEKLPWNKKLEVLRVMKDWNQDEAAKKCFTGQKTYWSWEKGIVYPRKNSIRAICQAFNVSENEIFN